MAYFITGATGFIGRHLLAQLAKRGETLYCLVRKTSEERLRELGRDLEDLPSRIVPVVGDLLSPRFGLMQDEVDRLCGEIEHFFHVAALYDLSADPAELVQTNVGGTHHALELALEVEARCFHYTSSLVVSGPEAGTFSESDFDPTAVLADAYAATKHDAEAMLRSGYPRPYRIYRVAVVVGDSLTGETDKADGLYHVFPLIRRLRESIPDWLPRFGIEAGELNIVPVDYVARAFDHLAHAKELDGRTFHLCDPTPRKASEIVDEFCRVAGSPTFSGYVRLPQVPDSIARLLDATERLGPVKRVSDAVLAELGIPRPLLGYLGRSTRYGCDETLTALEDSGIVPPELEAYAAPVWDYWERTFAPLLVSNPKLAHALSGKRVLVTCADGALESEIALRAGAVGARLVLVGADRAKLQGMRRRIEGAGGRAGIHVLDCSTPAEMDALAKEVPRLYDGLDVVICGAPLRGERANEPHVDAMRARYFAPLDLILGATAFMRAHRGGHVMIITPSGLDSALAPPEIAAASALDAWLSAMAPDLAEDGVATTVLHVPPLDAKARESTGAPAPFGAISVERAVELACVALIERPRRASTRLGSTTELARAAAPDVYDAVAARLRRSR